MRVSKFQWVNLRTTINGVGEWLVLCARAIYESLFVKNDSK